jgi:hypothetical protein
MVVRVYIGRGGIFSQIQVLDVTFDERPANKLGVYTSEFYGRIKDYNLYYRGTNLSYIKLGSYTMGRDEFFHIHELSELTQITGMKIEILSTHNPNDHARIQELVPIFDEVISADLVNLDVEKTRENFDSSVSPGNYSGKYS